VFSYRGAFVRHLGRDEAVAEANQVLFFNAFEGYRVSHPVPGGDASLDLVVDEATLRELAPSALLKDGADLEFRVQRLRIDPLARLSDAGIPAGGGSPALSLPAASPAGARTGPARNIRGLERTQPRSWLLQPQPFQRRIPAHLRPHALRVPPLAAALHAGSTRSLKILTALPSAAWPTHLSRNAGDPFGERCHDREDMCGLRLQAGCKLHQVEDRRQDG